MFWFLAMGILAVIGIIALLASASAELRGKAFAVIGVAVVAGVVLTVFSSCATVEAGHIGLVKEFRDYTGTMEPGVHAKAPWQSVEDVNVRVQSKKIFMDGKEGAGSAVSAETQPVFAVVTINYHIRPSCSVDLYKEVGSSYFESIIEPRVQQVFKAQTVEYRTIEVAPSREEIRAKVQATLDSQLDNFCIDVDDFLITNLDFADGFSESIERKQIATQDALAALEKVKQAEYEADAAIETATGEAEALRLKAAAIRDNPQLIQLTMVENLADNVQLIMVPSNGNFIMPGDLFNTGGK
jgi:regulator of protease activity HflC (stomatin/prohibitin superfamily)